MAFTLGLRSEYDPTGMYPASVYVCKSTRKNGKNEAPAMDHRTNVQDEHRRDHQGTELSGSRANTVDLLGELSYLLKFSPNGTVGYGIEMVNSIGTGPQGRGEISVDRGVLIERFDSHTGFLRDQQEPARDQLLQRSAISSGPCPVTFALASQ